MNRHLTFLLFLIIGTFIYRSDIFTVKTINIQMENIACTDDKQIKNALNLEGENFFLIKSQRLEDILKKKFICINEVSLSRQVPDKINLSVSGRVPSAILINVRQEESSPSSGVQMENIATPSAQNFATGDKFVVDKEGVIFAKNLINISVPAFYIYDEEISVGAKFKSDRIIKSLEVINRLRQFGMEIEGVSIPGNKALIVHSLPKIILKLSDNIDVQLASLQLILEKAKIESNDLEFIDLRFDKPVVRFAPKKK